MVDYAYDLDDKVTQVKVGGAALTNYTYDPLSRRTQKDFALTPVQRSTYTYDLANQLTNLANGIVGGGGISTYGYTYDAVSNRLTMAATPGGTQNYAYDAIYQLTGVTGAQAHTYAYDKLGNRTTADSVAYTANNLNQYTTVGGVAQVYDANGNLTSDGAATYTYDEENRLASVAKAGVTTTYAYDAFNRRVSKTVGGVATYYVHEGADIAEEHDAAGALKADYVYGPLVDEPLTMTRGGTTYYYFTDGLGSVRNLTNSTGTIIESYDYDAYGKPTTTSTVGNPIMFTGRWYDAESGNYYYRARQYSPTIGRFLQRDPIGYYDSMNLYMYVGNNSVNFLDPSGLVLTFPGPSDPDLDDDLRRKSENDRARLRGGEGCGQNPIIEPREPSSFDQLLWGISWMASGLRVEIGSWRDKNTGNMVNDLLHFHLGAGEGLNKHHLPYELDRWLRNLWNVLKRKVNGWFS